MVEHHVVIALPLSLCISSMFVQLNPYLTSFWIRSPVSGGQTIFPKSRISQTNLKKAGRKFYPGDFGEACRSPLLFKVAPNPGDAVLFWDYLPRSDIDNHETFIRSGSPENSTVSTEAANDNTSLHGGCPVLEGEKWIATKWIRSAGFR